MCVGRVLFCTYTRRSVISCRAGVSDSFGTLVAEPSLQPHRSVTENVNTELTLRCLSQKQFMANTTVILLTSAILFYTGKMERKEKIRVLLSTSLNKSSPPRGFLTLRMLYTDEHLQLI